MLGFRSFLDGDFFGLGGPRVSCELRSYPFAFAGRDELEAGNRIILPPSVLEKLQQAGAEGPYLFEVSDLEGNLRSHVGVLEFIAQEETCYLPSWVLQKLRSQEGDVLQISLRKLPKATSLRLRPATVAFHRIFDQKTLLEKWLRHFAAITDGDIIAVEDHGQSYSLEVLEVLPGGAACVIDTDVEVEFATPKDAEAAASQARSREAEAEKAKSRAAEEAEELAPEGKAASSTRLFTGNGRRIDGEAAEPHVPEKDETDISEDPMPWKRRIPGGVKHTAAPYGVDPVSRVGQEAWPGHRAAEAAAAQARSQLPVAAHAGEREVAQVNKEEARNRVLEAAEFRQALQAEEIEQRRAQEEEAKRQAEAAALAEEARRKAAEEAKRRALAPEQVQMQLGSKAGGSRSDVPERSTYCCGCLLARRLPKKDSLE
eukprot:TRINITY_DN61259_c0_g1_i1.p1 TRINITY_DN61259_c0_g1~~TRINITY_DN61259_c0_g1_i1.p1  ORF type:complete len:429 (+),score=113.35 TRINITY_DN61259_c0_g1_i1:55-1341(+)